MEIKIIEKDMVRADAHHAFVYFKDGTKKPVEMTTVFAYLDKYNILHASKWEDMSGVGVTKIAAIDDKAVTCKGGYLYVNDHKIEIYGAGEGYIYPTPESKSKDHRYIVSNGTYKVTDGNSVSILHKADIKKEDAQIAYEIYMKLK